MIIDLKKKVLLEEIFQVERWKAIFAPDQGSLLDIRIYGTDESDYQAFLDLVKSRYSIAYSEDGTEKPLPGYEEIIRQSEVCSIRLSIEVSGIVVNCFFWSEEEIILDLLPEEVDSGLKAQGVFTLMRELASHLRKRVLITVENGSATQQWSEDHAICIADPFKREIKFLLAE